MTIGKLVNFNTVCPSVLGDRYSGIRLVKSGLGSEYTEVIDMLNAKAVSVANANGTTIPDVGLSTVHMFKNLNGESLYMLDEWIDKTTYEEGNNLNYIPVISDISSTDIAIIKQILAREGYAVNSDRVVILD